MPERKKNNLNRLRPTREGLRPLSSREPVESEMEKGWPPAWCVSFADMMTLLMSFFILWYALTIMKFPAELLTMKKIKELYVDVKEVRETIETYEKLTEYAKDAEEGEEKFDELIKESRKYEEILASLKEFLAEHNLSQQVSLKAQDNEFTISPQSDLLFDKGKAVINPQYRLLLKQIGFILKANPALVRIEGHTDDTPILPSPYQRYKYPSNWELSAARAVSVARFFINQEGIQPERIMVSGYGSLKPIVPNTDSENKAKNRRVEIRLIIGSNNNNNFKNHKK